MKLSIAISIRIKKICEEKELSINKLASLGYLTQSTVQSLVDGKSNNPKLLTILSVCKGLDVKPKEFFDDDVFDDIERLTIKSQ